MRSPGFTDKSVQLPAALRTADYKVPALLESCFLQQIIKISLIRNYWANTETFAGADTIIINPLMSCLIPPIALAKQQSLHVIN